MKTVKFHKKIDTTNPIMIAGWPGMGNVALGMVDYLRRSLKAARFAEIEIESFVAIDSVEIEDGMATLPKPPKNIFYYAKDPGLIIFEGEAQLQGQNGIDLLNKVLDVASEFKVAKIYSGAAFPLPISHKEPSEVFSVANKESLRNELKESGVKLMESGHVSGLNGLLLGFAAKRNIDAICLLATMPQYAITLPNPKASSAIIEVLMRLLNFKTDLHQMSEYIKETDERMRSIEEKIRDVFAVGEEEETPPAEKKIHGYIMDKIERLFREAKQDRAKAMILKKELDRWGLYNLYEDRFLDLFRENQ